MADPRLVDWIKSKEGSGYTANQLYDFLVKNGYDPNDVKAALNAVGKPVQAARPAPAPIAKPQPAEKPNDERPNRIVGVKPQTYIWIAILAIILVGAVMALTISFILGGTKTTIYQPKIPALQTAGVTTTTIASTTTTTFEEVDTSDLCDSMACFSQKFTGCERTAVTIKIVDSLIYYYEILGPKGNLCEVRTKFDANPNADWIGKSMICLYDNSKEFKTVVRDYSNCRGELYDKILGR